MLSGADTIALLKRPGLDKRLGGLSWTADATGTLRSSLAGADAEPVWRALAALVPETGRWPIVLGEPDDEPVDDGPDPAPVLAQAAGLDLAGWLAGRARDGQLETTALTLSKIPNARRTGTDRFVTVRDTLTDEYLPTVGIALIPSPRSWEGAAYVGFGAFNDCPDPAQHVALMRAWAERWGAQVFALANDQAELVAAHPPATRQEAAELAQQQFVYDADIVYQSELETREALATDLMTSTHWQFSWG